MFVVGCSILGRPREVPTRRTVSASGAGSFVQCGFVADHDSGSRARRIQSLIPSPSQMGGGSVNPRSVAFSAVMLAMASRSVMSAPRLWEAELPAS